MYKIICVCGKHKVDVPRLRYKEFMHALNYAMDCNSISEVQEMNIRFFVKKGGEIIV